MFLRVENPLWVLICENFEKKKSVKLVGRFLREKNP